MNEMVSVKLRVAASSVRTLQNYTKLNSYGENGSKFCSLGDGHNIASDRAR
jgi:hypothetical protein